MCIQEVSSHRYVLFAVCYEATYGRMHRMQGFLPLDVGPVASSQNSDLRPVTVVSIHLLYSSNKKLLGTSASLLVTSALLVVTRS